MEPSGNQIHYRSKLGRKKDLRTQLSVTACSICRNNEGWGSDEPVVSPCFTNHLLVIRGRNSMYFTDNRPDLPWHAFTTCMWGFYFTSDMQMWMPSCYINDLLQFLAVASFRLKFILPSLSYLILVQKRGSTSHVILSIFFLLDMFNMKHLLKWRHNS